MKDVSRPRAGYNSIGWGRRRRRKAAKSAGYHGRQKLNMIDHRQSIPAKPIRLIPFISSPALTALLGDFHCPKENLFSESERNPLGSS